MSWALDQFILWLQQYTCTLVSCFKWARFTNVMTRHCGNFSRLFQFLTYKDKNSLIVKETEHVWYFCASPSLFWFSDHDFEIMTSCVCKQCWKLLPVFLWYSFQEQDLTRPYNKYLINYVICLVIITGKSQTSALMFDRAQGFGLRFPRNELTLG